MPPTMDFEAYLNEELDGKPFDVSTLLQMEDDVPIVMDHMGYPDATKDAIRVVEEHRNVVLGTTVIRFYGSDPSQAYPEAIAEAVRRLGPERVVFGSNLPKYRHSPLWTRRAIERLKLGAGAEEMIFSTNLARLYGLA